MRLTVYFVELNFLTSNLLSGPNQTYMPASRMTGTYATDEKFIENSTTLCYLGIRLSTIIL